MRETPNLARNTVFVEEAAPKPHTQQPYRGGRPGAPPSGIRDGDWQCPECPNVNFARRMECHRCGAPRPYEPRKPRARQLRDDEEPRYRRPRPRDRSEERDRHRRRSRSRSRDGGRKFERGRHKGSRKTTGAAYCQNDNWGWRKVRYNLWSLRRSPHRSATAARAAAREPRARRGPRRGFNSDDASDRRAPPPDEDDGYDDFGRRKKAKGKAERGRAGRWTKPFGILRRLVPAGRRSRGSGRARCDAMSRRWRSGGVDGPGGAVGEAVT